MPYVAKQREIPLSLHNPVEERLCAVALAWASIPAGMAREFPTLGDFMRRLEEVRDQEAIDRQLRMPPPTYCPLLLDRDKQGHPRLHVGHRHIAQGAAVTITAMP